jgi:Glycosyl hydrolase family 47
MLHARCSSYSIFCCAAAQGQVPITNHTSWRKRWNPLLQEHLACFFPGNMALGVYTGAVTGAKADEYMRIAKAVTHTCWQMYERMPSGERSHQTPWLTVPDEEPQ